MIDILSLLVATLATVMMWDSFRLGRFIDALGRALEEERPKSNDGSCYLQCFEDQVIPKLRFVRYDRQTLYRAVAEIGGELIHQGDSKRGWLIYLGERSKVP